MYIFLSEFLSGSVDMKVLGKKTGSWLRSLVWWFVS